MSTSAAQREQQARREAGHTEFAAGAQAILVGSLLLALALGTGWQLAAGLRAAPGVWPRTLDPLRLLPAGDEISSVARHDGLIAALTTANRRTRDNLAAFEEELESSSPMIGALVPAVNLGVTGWLGGSTETAYPGRDGWLFFRPDVEYVTSPGFLEPARLAARRGGESGVEPDPLPAIRELRDALAARGIELFVVIAPAKPTIYPEKYTARFAAAPGPVHNPSYDRFVERLRQASVHHVDLSVPLWAAKPAAGDSLYLQTDTHWTPAGMQRAAAVVAGAVARLDLAWDRSPTSFSRSPVAVTHQGDTLRLLRYPEPYAAPLAERVTIERIETAAGDPWTPDPDAEILVLGDSFANIYSLATLGWGSNAGFVEHLSALLGRPIDTIVANDNGSYATRLMLAGELARGRDRLAGKKLVIWEFAARELTTGDWRREVGYRR